MKRRGGYGGYLPQDAGVPAAWPALMSLAIAADYLSLDEHSFRQVTAQAKIGTIDLGLELERWRKSDLDTYLRHASMGPPEQRVREEAAPAPTLTEDTLVRLLKAMEVTKPPAVEPEAYRINDAVRISGLGRSTLYKLMADGALDPVRVGRRTLIKRSDLQRLLKGSSSRERVQIEPAS